MHMAINDVAGERVYHVWDILRELLGSYLYRSSYTLKPKNLEK